MTTSLWTVRLPLARGDVFVGRVRELAILECGLDGMQLGSRAAVLVAGEADLGKTRLESALGGRARDVGSGFSSGARSISLARSCRTSRRGTPAPRAALAGRGSDDRLATARLRRDACRPPVLALLTEAITSPRPTVDEGPAEWRRLVDRSGAIVQPVRDEPLRARLSSRQRSARTRRGSVQRGDVLPSSPCNARA